MAPGENLRPRGLDGGGVARRYPLGGVVVELRFHLVVFNVFGGKFWFSVFSLVFL